MKKESISVLSFIEWIMSSHLWMSTQKYLVETEEDLPNRTQVLTLLIESELRDWYFFKHK